MVSEEKAIENFKKLSEVTLSAIDYEFREEGTDDYGNTMYLTYIKDSACQKYFDEFFDCDWSAEETWHEDKCTVTITHGHISRSGSSAMKDSNIKGSSMKVISYGKEREKKIKTYADRAKACATDAFKRASFRCQLGKYMYEFPKNLKIRTDIARKHRYDGRLHWILMYELIKGIKANPRRDEKLERVADDAKLYWDLIKEATEQAGTRRSGEKMKVVEKVERKSLAKDEQDEFEKAFKKFEKEKQKQMNNMAPMAIPMEIGDDSQTLTIDDMNKAYPEGLTGNEL